MLGARRYQSATWRHGIAFIAVSMIGLQLTVVAGAFADSGPHRTAAAGFAVVTLLALAAMLRRFLRVAAYAEEDRLRIVNPLVTYSVPWSELAAVEFGHHRAPGMRVLAVRIDGTKIPIAGLALPIWRERQPEQSQAGQLAQSLAELARARRAPAQG